MIYPLIVIGLVLLYLLFTFVRINHVVKKANLTAFKHPDLLMGQGVQITYVAAGDSSAVGQGASKVSDAYPNKLAKKLSEKSQVSYKNYAVSGAKTSDVLQNQLDQIIEAKPDIVTISVGDNDLNHGIGSETVLHNLQTIANALVIKTNAQIFISNIPNERNAKLLPLWYRVLVDNRAKNLNKQIQKMDSGRIHIVDIHKIDPDFAADGFHPSSRGYQDWYQAFLDKMLENR